MADEKGGWEASEISTFAITSSLFSFQGLSWPTSSWLRERAERTNRQLQSLLFLLRKKKWRKAGKDINKNCRRTHFYDGVGYG